MGGSAPSVIVLCGPERPPAAVRERLPRAELVVAADSGLHHAAALGLRVDVVVGDLDSIDAEQLAAARADGVRVEHHPRDKDASDLELALATAVDLGAGRVVVVDGGTGPRVDHFLANALLLAHDRWRPLPIEASLGDAWVTVVRADEAPRALSGSPGSIVTLLAVGGAAHGLTSTGLRWVLAESTLEPGSTRGLSNELVADAASLSLAAGVVLAIQPLDARPSDSRTSGGEPCAV